MDAVAAATVAPVARAGSGGAGDDNDGSGVVLPPWHIGGGSDAAGSPMGGVLPPWAPLPPVGGVPPSFPVPMPLPLSSATTPRVYHLTTLPVEWDYAPLRVDACPPPAGVNGSAPLRALLPSTRTAFPGKAIFRVTAAPGVGASSPAATVAANRLVGPLLHAVVGEPLTVTVTNGLSTPLALSIPDLGEPSTGGGPPAPPGGSWTATWVVPPSAGPRLGRGRVAAHVYAAADGAASSGLFGVLAVVRDAGDLIPDRSAVGGVRAAGADDETVASLHTFFEARLPPGAGGIAARPVFATVSGYVHCNGPPLVVRPGGVTRLYVAALSDGVTPVAVAGGGGGGTHNRSGGEEGNLGSSGLLLLSPGGTVGGGTADVAGDGVYPGGVTVLEVVGAGGDGGVWGAAAADMAAAGMRARVVTGGGRRTTSAAPWAPDTAPALTSPAETAPWVSTAAAA
ncbi:hypothetical protein MMPV_009894 [Pyropia vietnamensis]